MTGGYLASLLQSLLALGAVGLLSWLVLRWGARRGFGRHRGHIKVVERVPLDARRALYLIEIGQRKLLIGAGEGALALLAELESGELPPLPANASPLSDLFSRWTKPSTAPRSTPPSDESD